jgi:hypothetical protein
VAGGFETRLFQDLQGSGYKTSYVGSVSNNASTVLTDYGQTHEEGHPGCFTSYIYNNLNGSDNSDAYSNNDGGYWLAPGNGVNPDFITLLVGTNDIGFGNGPTYALNELGNILDEITALRPNAHILVSNLLPRTDSATADGEIVNDFNPYVPGLVAAKDALGEKVTFVDLYDLINPSTDLGSDGLHPNQTGYNIIGDAWYEAIENIENQSVPEPSSIALLGSACVVALRRRRK